MLCSLQLQPAILFLKVRFYLIKYSIFCVPAPSNIIMMLVNTYYFNDR